MRTALSCDLGLALAVCAAAVPATGCITAINPTELDGGSPSSHRIVVACSGTGDLDVYSDGVFAPRSLLLEWSGADYGMPPSQIDPASSACDRPPDGHACVRTEIGANGGSLPSNYAGWGVFSATPDDRWDVSSCDALSFWVLTEPQAGGLKIELEDTPGHTTPVTTTSFTPGVWSHVHLTKDQFPSVDFAALYGVFKITLDGGDQTFSVDQIRWGSWDDAGDAGSGDACQDVSASAPPPYPFAFVVDDFERGPAPAASPNLCTLPVFNGRVTPSGAATRTCDILGLNSSSCQGDYYCDGSQYGGVCPEYIGADQGAWRGDYALRLLYNIDANPGAFAGVLFNLGNVAGSWGACAADRTPVDLTNMDSLSFRVRPGDPAGNAEIALQDEDGNETYPKGVLVAFGGAPYAPDQWSEAHFGVCDLLRMKSADGGTTWLNRKAIARVLIGFAKQRFVTEQTDLAGTRQIDLDDVLFMPCATTGCAPCVSAP